MNALITRLIALGLFRYLGIGAIGLLIWYTGPFITGPSRSWSWWWCT